MHAVRLTFERAKALCRLPGDFKLTGEAAYATAFQAWRGAVVEARQAGADGLAAELSQCKELFKRYRRRICPDCGGAKKPTAERCQMCGLAYRNSNKLMDKTMKEFEIEQTVLIPGRMMPKGPLFAAMRKLSETGQVGDSFVAKKSPSSITGIAKRLNMKVIYRLTNPEEKDRSKHLYRVWRTDGLSPAQVNEAIGKKLNG